LFCRLNKPVTCFAAQSSGTYQAKILRIDKSGNCFDERGENENMVDAGKTLFLIYFDAQKRE